MDVFYSAYFTLDFGNPKSWRCDRFSAVLGITRCYRNGNLMTITTKSSSSLALQAIQNNRQNYRDIGFSDFVHRPDFS
jgi:hypothetical protein